MGYRIEGATDPSVELTVPNVAIRVRYLAQIPALPFTSSETMIKLNSVSFSLLIYKAGVRTK